MPVPKKRTTSPSEAANVESSDHAMPAAQEFRQRLGDLAVSAMRVVIEEDKDGWSCLVRRVGICSIPA